MRRYERAKTLLTSNRPVDDLGKLRGDTAAVTALLDCLLHHAHVLKWPAELAHQDSDRPAPRGGKAMKARQDVNGAGAQPRGGLWTLPRLTRAWTALSKKLRGDRRPHPLGRRETQASAHKPPGEPATCTAGFPVPACTGASSGVTRSGLGRYLVVAGLEASTTGRSSSVHRGWCSPNDDRGTSSSSSGRSLGWPSPSST